LPVETVELLLIFFDMLLFKYVNCLCQHTELCPCPNAYLVGEKTMQLSFGLTIVCSDTL